MNATFRLGLVSVTALVLAGNAFAQGPASASGAPADPQAAAPAPGAAPSVSNSQAPAPGASQAEAMPAARAVPTGGTACVMGEHPADFPDSTRTATRMVCDALRQRGVNIGDVQTDATGASAAYVVNVDQLGSTFFLRVNYEEPVGTIKSTQRLSLRDFSEAEVAAPRIANAFTGGEKLEDAHYDDVVGSETRQYGKKSGEIVVGGGVSLLSMPSAGSYMGPALNLFGFYETTHWGVGLQATFGDADMRNNRHSEMESISVGGRYYFDDGNMTPLVGAGVAISGIQERIDSGPDFKGSGSAAYGEVGMEFLRLHKTHFLVTARVDVPMYKLDNSYYPGGYYYDSLGNVTTPATKSRYEVPLSLNVGIGF